jgi:hypothetical protein
MKAKTSTTADEQKLSGHDQAQKKPNQRPPEGFRVNEHLAEELRSIHQNGVSPDSLQRIHHVLQEEGITSASRFADLLIAWVESERHRASVRAPLEHSDLFAIDARRDPNARLVHRPPQGRFYWHGTAMDPKDIRRLDGKMLHFAVIDEGDDTRLVACEYYRDVVHLLRRRELLSLVRMETAALLGEHVAGGITSASAATRVRPQSVNILFETPKPTPVDEDDGGSSGGYVKCPSGPPRPTGEAQFFQHVDFDTGGHWFWLGPGWQIANLTEWVLSHAIFSGSASWNDEISSIRSGDGLIIAYEHIDFGGVTLSMQGATPKPVFSDPANSNPICGPSILRWTIDPPRQDIPNLVPFGWNDRISSLQHFPGV